KELSGRKRHLLVDTLGLVQGVRVHPADVPDNAGARRRPPALRAALPRLEPIWADAAYRGPLQARVREPFGWRKQIGEHPAGRGGGCAPTGSRPTGSRASTAAQALPWWSGRSRGSGAIGG